MSMLWQLACMLAALMLHCVVSGGNRLEQSYTNAAYDEAAAEENRNMYAAGYVKPCRRFLEAPEQRMPADCLDMTEADSDRSSGSSNDNAVDRSAASLLDTLFGMETSTAAPAPTTPQLDMSPAVLPHHLPAMYYNDFYEDLLTTKRNDVHSAGCDCKVTNALIDLGSQRFPRYLMNAVCESKQSGRRHELDAKCTHGSNCRPLEYKVKVLTLGVDNVHRSSARHWLPDEVSQLWKFETITVTAGCFCAK